MENMNTMLSSFSAAGTMPAKLLRTQPIVKGKILPRHVQLCPTNVCNLNCAFCSCAGRKRKEAISWKRMSHLLPRLAGFGTQAVTLTGGGEPLCYPQINDVISRLAVFNIKVGLVSNGYLFHDKLTPHTTRELTWSRISCSDDRDLDKLFASIAPTIETAPDVDWAFSYVVTAKPDWIKLNKVIVFANEYLFTHVRIVGNLMDIENSPSMDEVRGNIFTPDHRVIYQGRKDFDHGDERCLISLLKPVIAADGNVYPCCGAQYAIANGTGDFPAEMNMGPMEDLNQIVNGQKYFDGSVCDRCYYKAYNTTLDMMTTPLSHEEFV